MSDLTRLAIWRQLYDSYDAMTVFLVTVARFTSANSGLFLVENTCTSLRFPWDEVPSSETENRLRYRKHSRFCTKSMACFSARDRPVRKHALSSCPCVSLDKHWYQRCGNSTRFGFFGRSSLRMFGVNWVDEETGAKIEFHRFCVLGTRRVG